LVVDKIKYRILTSENLTNPVGMVNEEMDSASLAYREELAAVSDEFMKVGHRLERLYDAIEMNKLELDDIAPRIRGLRSNQELLQARKAQ